MLARQAGAATGMRVTVQLFARLRELAGRRRLGCDVPAGAIVGDVWRPGGDAHPALAPFETASPAPSTRTSRG